MPFIVTTKRPCVDPACPCQDGDPCHYETTADTAAMTPARVSRRAVATLEDPPGSLESGVRRVLYAMVPEEQSAHEHDDLYEQIDAITESGGTVGPLPDGTVIEVERVDWITLAGRSGHPLATWPVTKLTASKARILTAFNAREGRSTE